MLEKPNVKVDRERQKGSEGKRREVRAEYETLADNIGPHTI
jgi:hypothetical protein